MPKLRDYFISVSVKDLVSKPYKKLTKLVDKNNKSLARSEKEYKRTDKTLKRSGRTIHEVEQRYKRLSDRIRRQDVGSEKFKRTAIQIQRAKKELDRYNRALGRRTRGGAFSRGGAVIAGAAGGAAAGGASTLIGLLVEGLKSAVFATVNFANKYKSSIDTVLQSNLRQIRGVQSLGKDFESLSKQIRNSSGAFSKLDVEEFVTQLGDVGITPDQIKKRGGIIAKFIESQGFADVSQGFQAITSGRIRRTRGMTGEQYASISRLAPFLADPETASMVLPAFIRSISGVRGARGFGAETKELNRERGRIEEQGIAQAVDTRRAAKKLRKEAGVDLLQVARDQERALLATDIETVIGIGGKSLASTALARKATQSALGRERLSTGGAQGISIGQAQRNRQPQPQGVIINAPITINGDVTQQDATTISKEAIKSLERTFEAGLKRVSGLSLPN